MSLRSPLLTEPVEAKSSITKLTTYEVPGTHNGCGFYVTGATSTSLMLRDFWQGVWSYDLETRVEERFDGEKAAGSPVVSLPDNQFAVVVKGIVRIHCGESKQLLKEIALPLADMPTRFHVTQYEELSISLDGTQLCVKGEIANRHKGVWGEEHAMYFVIDLETDTVTAIRGERYSNLQIVKKNQFLLQTKLKDNINAKIEILHLNATEIIRSEVEIADANKIVKIFAWPQHPSVWIVACNPYRNDWREDCCEIYTYQVSMENGKTKAVRDKKLGTFRTTQLSLCQDYLMHHYAFIFRDWEKREFFEFDLTKMELRKLEIEGIESSGLRCIFPTGEIGIYGSGKEVYGSFFAVVELASERASATNGEKIFAEALDETFSDINKAGRAYVAPTLQRIISSYVSPRLFGMKVLGVSEPRPSGSVTKRIEAR